MRNTIRNTTRYTIIFKVGFTAGNMSSINFRINIITASTTRDTKILIRLPTGWIYNNDNI